MAPYIPTRDGKIALAACEMVATGIEPTEAWKRSTKAVLIEEGKKGTENIGSCGGGAFIGLCEEGLLKGTKRVDSSNSRRSKAHTLRAAKILLSEPSIASDIKELKKRVYGKRGSHKELYVVLSLFHHDKLCEP